tara:strand:- start:829 stop:1698 length:870 start_codon:yes stop_codon:yes gene_type:complete
LNRLAIGTAQFGLSYGIANQVGKVSQTEAKEILKLASNSGIKILDTAIAYGDSEKSLGNLGIQNFQLVTKLPIVPIDCQDVGVWVKEQVRSSFSRLGIKDIYGLLLHQSNQLLGSYGKDLYRELNLLKESGKVKKIGISIYSPFELEALKDKYDFDLVQAPFNIIDQRLHSSGWLSRLKNKGVEVHTRSVFLQGLLLMEQAHIPNKFLKWSDLWYKWHNWLDDYEGTATEACLSLPLSFPEIDKVIVGVDNSKQLLQILNSAKNLNIKSLPDLQCSNEGLINPANWPNL